MQQTFWANGPIQSVINGLLHQSVEASLSDKKRHQLFIGIHLAVGLLALAALPFVILYLGGDASAPQMRFLMLPVWMLAPLISVFYLSKTGNLANAFLLTATLTAAFVVWVAAMTGGLTSAHLIWLGVIPLEVALSGNTRIIKQALAICLLATGVLAGLEAKNWIEPVALNDAGRSLIDTISVMVAILYAGMLAIRIEWLHRGRLHIVQAEEMRYRTIADTVSDMITRHDSSGDVTFASPTAEMLLRTKPDQLSGNGLFQQIHIPDRPAYLRALSECMNLPAGSRSPVTTELRIMKCAEGAQEGLREEQRQAAPCWFEMKCAPERNEQGVIIGVIAATRDISKRKEQQFALEEARQEAVNANESKVRFLANVTHELRTPLNTIIGFSEILRNPELTQFGEEKKVEYADLIHKSGHHLLQLVNALLDMSRLESGNFEIEPQSFDLCDLTEGCCKMMQGDADTRKIALSCQCEPGMPVARLDPRACRQILLNLISNALKFSDQEGRVDVSLAWAKDKWGRKIKDEIELRVSDNGIGIDKADIPKLGKPFVQAENSLQRRFEGAGIGLSIVRGLTELQLGRMSITSELDKGTSVAVTLPLDMTAIKAPVHGAADELVISLNPAGSRQGATKKQNGSNNKVA
ncbi:PAS domain-containing sensor histidine kinase [uncultured Cohaesibacter sp.]|uniref:PAS domain-containing sensor histidine kinase n=1 Tax=uncultured Cohaesibacter sp. TaxID=1002546 RepID=UPI00292F31B6|nr:PAS domain-containing sensor histidine kinase [uncultured Cohaesibacter sp.]